MNPDTLNALLAILIVLGGVAVAWTLKTRGFVGAAVVILVFFGSFAAYILLFPIVSNWGAKKAENIVQTSYGTQLLGDLVEPVSPNFAQGLETLDRVPDQDKWHDNDYDWKDHTDPAPADVPEVVPNVPIVPLEPAPSAVPAIWTFPQTCEGLEMAGQVLTLYHGDGSGASRIVPKVDTNGENVKICACGWTLDERGLPSQLLACGNGGVETFDPLHVHGTGSLPLPPPPPPVPAPTPTPVPTPDPAEEGMACGVDWLRFRESGAWYDTQDPTGNFPKGYACQIEIKRGLGFLTPNTYRVNCPGIGVAVGIPSELGRSLEDFANSEQIFQGSGLMCE